MRSVEQIKKIYKKGTKVELVRMADRFAPSAGTKGVVICVDDIGTVHVAWEDGSSLGVCLEVDTIKRI